MNEASTVQIISLVGWLILMLGAFASYKLSWRKGLTFALIWVALFAGVAALIMWSGAA
jgi:hypothetical protein